MSSKTKGNGPAPQITKPAVANPNPEVALKSLLEQEGLDYIGKLILIEMDKRAPEITHKIHLSIQKDLDQLYYSGIENKIESKVRSEVEARVLRIVPEVKTSIVQAIEQKHSSANPDVHQESREKKRRLNESESAETKKLEQQLQKFSDMMQMVMNQNKAMQNRIEMLESELKKQQSAVPHKETSPETKHVPAPMAVNVNAKTVEQVEKQVDSMVIDKPTANNTGKNRKKK